MNCRPCRLLISLTCSVLVGCSYGTALENSGRAVKLMHTLNSAEAEYRRQHGHYGDLSALGPSGANLIAQDLASGKASGYEFHLKASVSGYVATAWPLVQNKTGFRSLYCNESGVIRGNWTERATATSEPVSQVR